MPQYSYKAKNLKGGQEEGIMEAADQNELAKALRQKGYFLLSASQDKGIGKKTVWSSLGFFFNNLFGVPLAEKLFFTRNLEIMVKTGVALPRALNILSQQIKNGKFKRILVRLSEDITKGESLSSCLAAFPAVFPVVYQETLKIGEETGKLEDALHILSLQIEREHKLKSSVSSAMVYPAVVIVMGFIIGVIMFVFAVPKLKMTFADMNVILPLTTRAIFALADFLVQRWPFALLIFVILAAGAFLSVRAKKGSRLKSFVILKMPVIGKVSRTTNMALALRTLSSLLEAGVPIVRALDVASGSLRNFYFKQSLKQVALAVEKGTKLSQAIAPYANLYAATVFHMMEVGEETGETPGVLKKLADFYEDEVISSTQKLASLMEPALIILVGLVVGFFALSMLQPMFSITNAIK
ncbi:MAG: type II secretion system F family protein [Candidatus Pacebacteria bacterium]|nr:type II secretion system F family protein [Candidatus Paceibacterota bacterium]